MSILQSLVDYFIQLGFGLGLLLCLTEYARQDKPARFTRLFWVGLLISSLHLRLTFFIYDIYRPYYFVFFLTTIFAFGPAIWQMMQSMLGFLSKEEQPIRIHYLPALIVMPIEVTFFLMSDSFVFTSFQAAITDTEINIVSGLLLVGQFHLVFYYLLILRRIREITMDYEFNLSYLSYALAILSMVTSIAIGVGFFIGSKAVLTAGIVLFTLTIIVVYLFNARYPNYFISLKDELKRQDTERTQIRGINIDTVKDRLIALMEERGLYTDDKLRLYHLADELLVPPYQLSRILNEHYGKNFNEFINGYRVRAAQKLLNEKQDMAIQNIVHEVGFSNKATFNAQFLRIVGMTPAQFRRQNTN